MYRDYEKNAYLKLASNFAFDLYRAKQVTIITLVYAMDFNVRVNRAV